MGLLEQVTKLKSQGIPEDQIIRILQEQGISPKQVNDALNQSQIKNAVSDEGFYKPNMDGMQPSIMEINPEFQPPRPENRNNFSPPVLEGIEHSESRTQSEFPSYEEYTPQEPYPQPPSQNQQEFYQPQENYQSQEVYNPQQDYSSNSTDTIIDVAEQVFDEKIIEIKKQLQEVSELKNIAEIRINHLEKRLDKIESLIDKLQISILEKIGSYGNNLQSIKNEMSMMQDSFGKMINPLKDIAEEVQKPHHHTTAPEHNHTIHNTTHATHKKSSKKR